MGNERMEKEEKDQEKPPILSSWNWLYTLVLLNLALYIVLFYIFTRIFD